MISSLPDRETDFIKTMLSQLEDNMKLHNSIIDTDLSLYNECKAELRRRDITT
jgi:hypothetical protein